MHEPSMFSQADIKNICKGIEPNQEVGELSLHDRLNRISNWYHVSIKMNRPRRLDTASRQRARKARIDTDLLQELRQIWIECFDGYQESRDSMRCNTEAMRGFVFDCLSRILNQDNNVIGQKDYDALKKRFQRMKRNDIP